MDANGSSDPRVRVLAGQFKTFEHSQIIPNTLNPTWDAEFAYVAYPELSRFSPLVQRIAAVQGASEADLRAALESMFRAPNTRV